MVAPYGQIVGNFLSRSGDYLRVNRWVRAAIPLAALTAAVVLLAEPAAAHNSFSSSNPKDKAVLDQAPATVSLKFLSKLSPGGTKVSIAGPDGKAAGGQPSFDGPTVTIPLTPGAAGVYTVSYQVASPDGHPISGKVTFTLTAKAVPGAAPATTAAPATSAAPVPVPTSTIAAPVAVSGVPTSATGDGGMPWWPWALLAALVVAGGAGLALARRRRPQ
jgi:methionine-rich copper-binding protein CopC